MNLQYALFGLILKRMRSLFHKSDDILHVYIFLLFLLLIIIVCFICPALSGGPLIFIIMTCVGNNPTIVMALMVTAATCFIFIFIGFNINHLDLTPNFAGVLMGICNGFEMITTTISPTAVGFMVSDPSSIELWRRVFVVTAVIGITSSLIYAVFGSGKIQPWNEPSKSKNKIPLHVKQASS